MLVIIIRLLISQCWINVQHESSAVRVWCWSITFKVCHYSTFRDFLLVSTPSALLCFLHSVIWIPFIQSIPPIFLASGLQNKANGRHFSNTSHLFCKNLTELKALVMNISESETCSSTSPFIQPECYFVFCFGFYMLKLILWFYYVCKLFLFAYIKIKSIKKNNNWSTVPEISKARPNFMFICNLSKSFRDKLSLNLETRRQKCLQSQEIEQPASLLQPRSISKSSTNKMQKKVTGSLLINDQLSLSF